MKAYSLFFVYSIRMSFFKEKADRKEIFQRFSLHLCKKRTLMNYRHDDKVRIVRLFLLSLIVFSGFLFFLQKFSSTKKVHCTIQ